MVHTFGLLLFDSYLSLSYSEVKKIKKQKVSSYIAMMGQIISNLSICISFKATKA